MTPSSAGHQFDFLARLARRDDIQMYTKIASEPDADDYFVRLTQPPLGGDPEVLPAREPGGRWVVRADRGQNKLYLNLSCLDLEATDDPEVREVILDVGAAVLFHNRGQVDAPDEALTLSAISTSRRPVKP
jgi:hypothetical protein